MIQCRQRDGFAREARHTVGVIGKRLRKYFDGDGPIEPGVGGAIDLADSARAGRSRDPVWAQAGNGNQREGAGVSSRTGKREGRRTCARSSAKPATGQGRLIGGDMLAGTRVGAVRYGRQAER
jgi:hypothetical protein